MNNALSQYKSVDVGAGLQTASPHQLICMLFDGALEALAKAQGAIERNDFGQRSTQINKATGIVLELKSSLNADQGGELASNLEALYTYMTAKLLEANRTNSAALVQEVSGLLHELSEGWSTIPPEYRKQQD